MAVVVSTNPIEGQIDVLTTSSIEFILETTTVFNISSLDIEVIQEGFNPSQVVVNGAPQSGYVLNTTIAGSQLTILLSFGQALQSYKNIIVNLQIDDNLGTLNTQLSFKTIDVNPPMFANFSPSANSLNNGTSSPIYFEILDNEGININSLNIIVKSTISGTTTIIGQVSNGLIVSGFESPLKVSQSGNKHSILGSLISPFPSGAKITVETSIEDSINLTAQILDFYIIDIEPPIITPGIPTNNQSNVNEGTTISFIIEDVSEGVDFSSLNVLLNSYGIILSGIGQNLNTISITPSGLGYICVVTLAEPLNSAETYFVEIQVKDNRGNLGTHNYQFSTINYLGPRILDFLPQDGYSDIQPHFDVFFKVKEDQLNSLQKLVVTINGELALSLDGIDEFYSREIYNAPIVDGYWTVLNRGYKTSLEKFNEYITVLINSITDFNFNENVLVNIEAEDNEYLSTTENYNFQITDKLIVTTASFKGGKYDNYIDGYSQIEKYKLLTETGIRLSCNYPDCRTFYTKDGTVPKVDKYGVCKGTTKLYDNEKILLNSAGQHILKFFSIDSAGTQESVKQEVYLITPFPPKISIDQSIKIVSDIDFQTKVIPVEETFLFQSGQSVRILDNIRSPVYTKVVSVYRTANPKYITVEIPVEKLKVSRNARVEIQETDIDTKTAIEIDTTTLNPLFYIGSDGNEENQCDAILEQLRILNRYSTTEEVIADYTLFQKGQIFYCSEENIDLGEKFSALENARANICNQTLVLLDFDGSIDNKGNKGILAKDENVILDKTKANNIVVFKIPVKKGKFIDRELLKQVLRNFTPVDLEIIVEFEEVE